MGTYEARVPVPAAVRERDRTASSAPGAGDAVVPAAPVPLAGVAAPGAPLVVGHADDPAEHHADALADRALERLRRTTGGPPADDDAAGGPDAGDPHRHTPGCGHLRRAATPVSVPGSVVGPGGGDLDEQTSARVERARGRGAPLEGTQRRRFETAFDRPLGHVRVHRGPEAARLNDAMSAEAFTLGDDIFLGARAGAVGPAADGVLAHEIAHVLSEPGGVRRREVRRFTPGRSLVKKIFGKKEPSEEEKRQKAEKAAAEQRAKDEEKARKLTVKQSKKTEKAERASLKQARARGEAGRAALTEKIYAPGAQGEDESGERMTAITQRFEEALEYERGLFRFLTLGRGRRGGGQPLGEEEAADQAYHQTWYVRYPDLEAVRPPRETAAERLVIQVRRARTEANVAQQAVDDATDEDKARTKLRMLGKDVERAYDRMVVHRDDLLAQDPAKHPALAQDEAAEEIRAGLDDKVAARMPPKDGPLDVAAWTQATERGAARQRQAQRDRTSIEESLALLPADERADKQAELDATPVKWTKPKDDTLSDAEDVVKDIGTYGGPALKGVSAVAGGIAGAVGKRQDKALRAEQGVQKTSYGPTLPGVVDQGVSAAVRDGRQAADWKAKGLRAGPTTSLPTSDATKAKDGIGQVTGILTSLLSAVKSALAMVRSTKTAWSTGDVYEGLKATKSGAAGLDGLVGAARHTANLAKTIDSGVAAGVKQVVPGLDIATAALAMVRGVMDVASTGMRQRETDLSMFEARAQSTTKVAVTVYPLMKVSQVYTKQLENSCWGLGSSIADFALGIAQVASGGGFGIPLAIKSAKLVLDNLHDLGHFIADQVLAVMAKRANKESEVLHLEGAAEAELSRHPKMAVDGIVLRAAQGDPAALMFLSGYRVDGRPITADYVRQIKPSAVGPGASGAENEGSKDPLLLKIRAAVLGSMDTDADPKTAYDELMDGLEKAQGLAGKGKGLAATWHETGDLAQRRNALAGGGHLGGNTKKSRGVGWRVRMFLSSEKRGKLAQRTAAYEDMEPLPAGIVCVVGDRGLGRGASDEDAEAWGSSLTVADLEAELARRPRRNPPEGIELIRELLRLKTGATAAVSTVSSDLSAVGGTL